MAKLIGILICPECGHKQKQEIPERGCVPFYKCNKCRKRIVAKTECCVFCEYSDTPCPVSHNK